MLDAVTAASSFLDTYPVVSHALWGAGGGVAYLALRLVERNKIFGWREIVARLFLSAFGAVLITSIPGVPNHLTSTAIGFVGISVWQAIGQRLLLMGLLKPDGTGSVPGHYLRIPSDVFEQEINSRIETLSRSDERQD